VKDAHIFVWLDDPDAVQAAVRRFVESLGDSGRGQREEE
jgi:hypothetical protein